MARALTESELIALASEGDGDAYASLLRAHQDIAFRTAMLITQDAADAEEAAQDAFVKAWRALPRFRAGEPWRPWLLTIVANEARNRRTAASRHLTVALEAAFEATVDLTPSPEALAVASDQHHRLVEALNELREEDRTIIVYRYLLIDSIADGNAKNLRVTRFSPDASRIGQRSRPRKRS